MPKISTTTFQILFISGCRILLFSITFSCFTSVSAQVPNQTKTAIVRKDSQDLLPSRLGENWKALGSARILSAEQFSILPLGDVFAEYGLETITTRDFTDGKKRYTVEVFQMSFKSGAYGLFTFNRRSLAQNRNEVFLGRYLVSILSEQVINELDPSLPSLIDSIKQNLRNIESGELPTLPLHLPQQDRIAESEIYLVGPLALAQLKVFDELKDVIIFTGGAEAVTASYKNGAGKMDLLLLEYHTPQLASDGHAILQAQFDSLPQMEKESRILTRTGNYIIEAINIEDKTSASSIVGQIKYTPRVYWEGRKPTDIPLEFRPADPAAIEEAFQTANVLIRTFYWIGVMLTSAIVLGVVAGGSFFYWKRHRRRKLGLDDLFSDAGGTVRLNLDEYLLTSPEQSIKKIGQEKEEK